MIDEHFGFAFSCDREVAVIHLSEHYDPDLHGCAWAEALVDRLSETCRKVIIDMGGYNRVDSRIFTGLIQAHRYLRDIGGPDIALRGVGPRVRVGLDMLRLSPFFSFEHRSDSPRAICVG